ncbi:MAG: glycosyltransferase family 2 protein [Candidatus Handelsmanbacteria bacterium]|nr:glycosyltransferase family 2 protein [Candidatus Handelsmanbacteria bacterium]
MEALFWVSVLGVGHTYLLYPLLLWLLTCWRRPPSYPELPEKPSLSLIISAYNEEAVIGEKIGNSLGLEYPPGKLQVIVVSDGSQDDTDQTVRQFGGRGVLLHRMDQRAGKTAAQNAGVRLATGEVLVFTDANSLYAPGALRELVRPFADPGVGCVCGELDYLNPGGEGAGKGEGFYWRYEQFLKKRESRLCSLVGANGSIYALRRGLFDELAPEIISDFVMPLRVWRKGFRVVYAPLARATEHSGKSFREEFRRRTRIIARSLHGLRTEAGVLNPFAHPGLALQVLSHKVLRWLVPVFLLCALFSSWVLCRQQPYRALFAVQMVFYLLALAGNLAPRSLGRLGLFYIPAHFCAINLGALAGLLQFLAGNRYTVWQPIKRG